MTRQSIEVKQGGQGQAQGLGDFQQNQVGGISEASLQSADVRTIQFTLSSEIFLSPVLGQAKSANALAEPSERGVRRGARRHVSMVTMGYTMVYRPGSTRRATPVLAFQWTTVRRRPIRPVSCADDASAFRAAIRAA